MGIDRNVPYLAAGETTQSEVGLVAPVGLAKLNAMPFDARFAEIISESYPASFDSMIEVETLAGSYAARTVIDLHWRHKGSRRANWFHCPATSRHSLVSP